MKLLQNRGISMYRNPYLVKWAQNGLSNHHRPAQSLTDLAEQIQLQAMQEFYRRQMQKQAAQNPIESLGEMWNWFTGKAKEYGGTVWDWTGQAGSDLMNYITNHPIASTILTILLMSLPKLVSAAKDKAKDTFKSISG